MQQKEIWLSVLFLLILVLPLHAVAASTSSDFFSLLNAERIAAGRSSVSEQSSLATAASLHAQDMGLKSYFSHTSLDGTAFSTRIKNQGYVYRAAGENIAYSWGKPDASVAFTLWKNSPGHYTNMISTSYTEAGFGFYYDGVKTYYVLDLATPRSSPPPIVPPSPPSQPPQPPTPPPPSVPQPPQPSAPQFELTQVNYTAYAKVSLKAHLSQAQQVSYVFQNQSKKVCTSCSRFYLTLKTSRATTVPLQVTIGNTSYSFIL